MGPIHNLLNILRPRLPLHVPLSRCWVNPLSIGFTALEILSPLLSRFTLPSTSLFNRCVSSVGSTDSHSRATTYSEAPSSSSKSSRSSITTSRGSVPLGWLVALLQLATSHGVGPNKSVSSHPSATSCVTCSIGCLIYLVAMSTAGLASPDAAHASAAGSNACTPFKPSQGCQIIYDPSKASISQYYLIYAFHALILGELSQHHYNISLSRRFSSKDF
jgi:hypothetical protein